MTNSLPNAVSYERGDVLYAVGEDSRCLYLVVSGEVMIFSGDSKKMVPVNVVREKDFLGEQSLFANTERKFSAIVSQDASIMKIESRDVDDVLKLCPDWVSDIMKLLSERLMSTNYALYEHNIISEIDSELSSEEMNFFKQKLEAYLG